MKYIKLYENFQNEFDQMSYSEKIKCLIDLGLDEKEAYEICPDENTKLSDLPSEIRECLV